MISNFLRIFEPKPSERFSNPSYKLSLLSNFGNKSSFSCNVGLNPYRLYPFFLKIEKNVFTLFFNLFILGDLIPVLNKNFPVNSPVVDNKVASAQL